MSKLVIEQPDGSNRGLASAERRSAILHATLELLAARGLHQTKIADIVRKSGASIGSIYHHFGSREGVFYALYIETFEHCFAELRAAVLPSTTARAGIRNLADTYLRWVEQYPARATFIYDVSQGDILRSFLPEIAVFKGAFYAEIFAWMQPFIAAGEIIALPPWAYDAIMMGPAHEFARRWLGGQRELPMSAAREIIADAIWRAMQPATS